MYAKFNLIPKHNFKLQMHLKCTLKFDPKTIKQMLNKKAFQFHISDI